VTKLITLLEKQLDPEPMKEFGIDCLWLPINDMEAPKLEEAIEWCQRVEGFIRDGLVTAYHCKAGMGRTGTMLAAQLIWEGMQALEALETARKVEPSWVQSEVQVKFLEDFEKKVKNLA
jgi:atypical dual specificity phosphatase